MTTRQEIAGKGHSNTNKKFRYTLLTKDDNPLTLFHVPEGWKSGELTFIRDSFYKGVIESYSTNSFEFIKEGRDFIQTAYERGGIDYEIKIYIDIKVNSTFGWQRYFTGKLDLSTYIIDSISAKCEIIPTGFQSLILNRDSIDVDLLSEKFIGGGTGSMAQLTGMPTTLRIPAYQAKRQTDWIMEAQIDDIDTTYVHYVPMEVNSDEFPVGVSDDQTLLGTTPFFTNDETRTIKLEGTIIVAMDENADPDANLAISIDLYKNSSVIQTYSDSHLGTSITFTFPVDESISLNVSDELSLRAVATHDGEEVELTYVTSGVTISADIGTQLDAVDIEGFPIYEFVTRILQLTSGETIPLHSDLLGRTDSVPDTYSSDGDGSLMSMTKGRLIREFPLANLVFNGSLKDVFKTLNSIRNIGLGFEVIGGVNKVRIEKESYFFDITDNPNYPATDSEAYLVNQILDLSGSVTNELISKEVLPDWYANEISVGYQNFEYENVQGLKEFNTKSLYTTPLKSVKRKLDLVAEYRYDTQGANKLREKPYSTDSTEDVNGDNHVFGFDVKRLGVFTVKTDEDFDLVTGGIDPSESYNLDFTPRRNLERHGNVIRSMQFDEGKEIQWMKSDKNTKLVTQKPSEADAKAENADITVNDFTLGYWIPEAYICEAPVNEATIAALQANPRGVIKIGTDKYMWILEVQTNNDENKGQFKGLRVDLTNVKVVV